jgi:hypothetical protein
MLKRRKRATEEPEGQGVVSLDAVARRLINEGVERLVADQDQPLNPWARMEDIFKEQLARKRTAGPVTMHCNCGASFVHGTPHTCPSTHRDNMQQLAGTAETYKRLDAQPCVLCGLDPMPNGHWCDGTPTHTDKALARALKWKAAKDAEALQQQGYRVEPSSANTEQIKRDLKEMKEKQ